jgi:hypothetical protein
MRRPREKRARGIHFALSSTPTPQQLTTKPSRHQSQSGAAKRENQRERVGLFGKIAPLTTAASNFETVGVSASGN